MAKQTRIARVGELLRKRDDGSLGDQVIKLAHCILLCTLPYSKTDLRQTSRSARLGDGTTLVVTFSCGLPEFGMPFGADRHLLAWILDRAIRNDSAFIPWTTASEYLDEMGIQKNGRSRRQLTERFERINGLVIAVQRHGETSRSDKMYTMIDHAFLPTSIMKNPDQHVLPELNNGFGIKISDRIFDEIKRFNYAVPRDLWLKQSGPHAIQDLVLWLFCRCYAAKSETVIPWKALEDQFPQESNTRRLRIHAHTAIDTLNVLWPGIKLLAIERGIEIGKPSKSLLLDDAGKNRYRSG